MEFLKEKTEEFPTNLTKKHLVFATLSLKIHNKNHYFHTKYFLVIRLSK